MLNDAGLDVVTRADGILKPGVNSGKLILNIGIVQNLRFSMESNHWKWHRDGIMGSGAVISG